MIMADVFKFVFLILGFYIAFLSYWLLAAGLFPRMTDRCESLYRCCPIRLTLLGLIVIAPLVGFGIWLFKHPQPLMKVFGGAAIFLPLLLALIGSAGLCQHIGAGLQSPTDAGQPWRRVFRGGLVLAATFLMPIIGWLIVFPLTMLSGFGVGLVGMFRGGPPTPPAIGSTPGTP
jgi:hypothetical protein